MVGQKRFPNLLESAVQVITGALIARLRGSEGHPDNDLKNGSPIFLTPADFLLRYEPGRFLPFALLAQT